MVFEIFQVEIDLCVVADLKMTGNVHETHFFFSGQGGQDLPSDLI